MTFHEIDFSRLSRALPGCFRAATAAAGVAIALSLTPGVATAAPAGVPPGEEVTLTEQYGTATVSAEPYVLGIRVYAEVTDTRSDSRCAYVRYKVDASGWFDPDGKLVRVCGHGRTASRYVEWVGPTWSSARHVEVQVCREQGFGPDPCGPVQELDL